MKQAKKTWINVIMILVILMAAVLGAARWVTGSVALAASAEPDIDAKGAIVYCATTGEVIWEKNADKKYNPASMTKLMTCLLAIENLELDQKVTVTEEATKVIPSMMYLSEGEEISVRDLIYAAILESDNDAAAALAIAVSGSTEDFAKLMNQRVKEIGCTSTNFVNPHGLYAKKHRTTARDMALIAAEAFKNETLREIAGVASYTIEATNKADARTVKTTNLFLEGGTQTLSSGTKEIKAYDGVFGGKTGTSEEGVATMVVGMEYDGVEIYAVVMGDTTDSRYTDIKKLLDYGKENVSKYMVFDAGEAFGQGKLVGGAVNRVDGVAGEAAYIYLPEGASPSLITKEAIYDEDLEAPIQEGQKIGTVEIYLADEKVGQVSLTAAETVEKGWFLSRWGITNFQTLVLCVAVCLILLFFLLILTLRAINRKKQRARRRRKAMEAAQRELEREKSMKQRGWPY